MQVERDCLIGHFAVLYEGVRLGARTVLDDRVRIGYDTVVGEDCRVMYQAFICDRVRVGARSRVAGFVCDGAELGADTTVLGELVHELSHPHEDWWGPDEPAPVVESGSVVGSGARIIGGIRVGPRSYVAAGAIVTRDVPPEHIATGTNRLCAIAHWPGRKLQDWIAAHTR